VKNRFGLGYGRMVFVLWQLGNGAAPGWLLLAVEFCHCCEGV
jgi:hypothetical protein